MLRARWLEGALALAGAILAVNLLGAASYNLVAFEFKVETRFPARPETRIALPPIGEVAAATHVPPLLFRLTLENVDLDGLSRLLTRSEGESSGNVLARLREEAGPYLWRYGLRLLLLAALGGAGGVGLLHRRDVRSYARGALGGVALFAALLALTAVTYDAAAFSSPQYQGVLRHAPWVVSLAQEAATDIDLLGKQMQVVGQSFQELSQRLRQLDLGTSLEGTLRLLHVSDIHNNPAAFKLIAETAQSFQVRAIIDTGDLTDYGTPLEGQLLKDLRRLNLPYYFVPGNHDSPSVIRELSRLKGVRVVREGTVSLEGLRLVALADPAAAGGAIEVARPEVMQAAASRLESLVREQEEQVDLVAVHNPLLAEPLAGKVPVVVAGHTHRYGLEVQEGTVLVNAGTTGAAGLRSLAGKGGVPYSLAVLYWRRAEEGKWYLVGVDLIRVLGGEHSFSLERRVFPLPKDATGKAPAVTGARRQEAA